MKEKFNCIGKWRFSEVNKLTGEILHTSEWYNTVVNTGKERVAKLLNGISSSYFNSIAIGVGTTPVTASDIELDSELTREEAVLSYESGYQAKFTYTFSFGGDYDITEAALFDSDVVSGSTMFNRVVFSARHVSTTIDLVVEAYILVG